MGYALTYANKLTLAAMTPAVVASSKYCLANPGVDIWFINQTGESFSVRLGAGSIVTSGSVRRGAGSGQNSGRRRRAEFKPPFHGDAVLYLHQTKE
jgi:hypothetical protein